MSTRLLSSNFIKLAAGSQQSIANHIAATCLNAFSPQHASGTFLKMSTKILLDRTHSVSLNVLENQNL